MYNYFPRNILILSHHKFQDIETHRQNVGCKEEGAAQCTLLVV